MKDQQNAGALQSTSYTVVGTDQKMLPDLDQDIWIHWVYLDTENFWRIIYYKWMEQKSYCYVNVHR